MFENNSESPKNNSFTPPAVELLSDPSKAHLLWPEDVVNDQDFMQQLESRQKLNKNLDAVLAKLARPDVSLQEAFEQKQLNERELIDLYNSLTELIEGDSDYQRIVLYLPFEFLPNTNWETDSAELDQALDKFRATYMKAWGNLLTIHDVRANFVDGDVLETELRVQDLPRVVKAAHLIPKLMSNGLISLSEVLELIENSEDEVLKQSIADTFLVLADLGLLTEADLVRMQASSESLVRDQAQAILLVLNSKANLEKNDDIVVDEILAPPLEKKLETEFSKIDAESYTSQVTAKRANWLRQEKKQQVLDSAGDDISSVIIKGEFNDEQIEQFIKMQASSLSQEAFVNGLTKAIENLYLVNPEQARIVYERYSNSLLDLWQNASGELRNALTKTFCHLHALGIVNDKQLADLEITIPNLAGPFSENLKNMSEDIADVQSMIHSIESDPELSKYIYPVALVFGSRLKGYGSQDADIDIGVIVKPNISIDSKNQLRALLQKKFAHDKIHGEITEFWLEETEDGLGVRDFEKADMAIGESSWTHILFGAAWEGDNGVINDLRKQLLTPYMYDKDKTIHGRKARGLYLEELERDTLQYRLMHKGYQRFFPASGGINTPHADKIDGKSTFWDSGYRQMATKLFASRVFLPKISKV